MRKLRCIRGAQLTKRVSEYFYARASDLAHREPLERYVTVSRQVHRALSFTTINRRTQTVEALLHLATTSARFVINAYADVASFAKLLFDRPQEHRPHERAWNKCARGEQQSER